MAGLYWAIVVIGAGWFLLADRTGYAARRWKGRLYDLISWWHTPSDRFAALIALSTIALVVVAAFQLNAMNRTDDAIHRQLKVIEADQRPWMKVEKVEAYVHPLGYGGLQFNGGKNIGFLPYTLRR